MFIAVTLWCSEQRLAKYDANGDGVLDAAEQQRMRDEEELAQLQAVLGGVVTHEPDGATSLLMAYIDEKQPGIASHACARVCAARLTCGCALRDGHHGRKQCGG